ncbi:MAG: hypothetical protein HUU16_10465 [Candidatus Omnitrophica bacterium]|nr:hypothetical protein [bacterium]NUN96584.1 hypothetical protein [Candidatus Omnitrophota bacterium]
MRPIHPTRTTVRLPRLLLPTLLLAVGASAALAQPSGFLEKDGATLFPLGFYEFPKEESAARRMVDAGVNLVRVTGKEDLDRAEDLGLQGVLPVRVDGGATEELRQRVESVKDHPALAVWEGPDEVVWNFTAYSGLHRTLNIYPTRDEWWRQTPLAYEYSEKKASEILPKMREGIELIRALDARKRPFWINEAMESDVKFARAYMDWIDITGCDIYPVKKEERLVGRMAHATDRWGAIGRGKPVWMVMQAFSWHELGDYYGHKEAAYPTFAESRFMAYSVIAHGASGILYWGSEVLTSESFRESLYSLVSELSALQPFLVAPDRVQPKVTVIPSKEDEVTDSVRAFARRAGEDWLLVVVNENDQRHMGVVVAGLEPLEARTLELLYGKEAAKVTGGETVLRLQPYEVKVYCTSRGYESARRQGREGD